MITLQVAFPLHTLSGEDETILYGAMVVRVLRETVGDPDALLSGQADWLTGEIVPVAMAVTYEPDLSRVPDMVTGLTVLAAMYEQPVVAVALSNVEFFGVGAPSWLSEPGFPADDETARAADLDAWGDADTELDALARELSAFYGPDADGVPFASEEEATAYVRALVSPDEFAPVESADDEPQPETD